MGVFSFILYRIDTGAYSDHLYMFCLLYNFDYDLFIRFQFHSSRKTHLHPGTIRNAAVTTQY